MIENPFLKIQKRQDREDPQDQILTLWDLYSEEIPGNLQEILLQRRETVEQVDQKIDQKELGWLLWQYGVKGVQIKQQENGRYAIRVKRRFHDERLPQGYAYKGGAARSLLLRSLGIDLEAKPRDIDLLRTVPEEPVKGLDQELAGRYMAEDIREEDIKEGYGIEKLGDDYFDTRDFTINEVLATDDEVIATRACLLDTLRHILRITDYEKKRFAGIGPKMLAKLIRFYAEGIIKFDQTKLGDEESEALKDPFINSFWLALQLDKAIEIGEEVAERFVQECVVRGLLPKSITGVGQAAEYLLHDVYDFYFRHALVGQREKEARWAEEDKLDFSEKFEKQDRRKKRKNQ